MHDNYSIANEILKLKSLMDDGIITQEEFSALKRKLVSNNESENVSQTEKYYSVTLTKIGTKTFAENLELIVLATQVSNNPNLKVDAGKLPMVLTSGLTLDEANTIKKKFQRLNSFVSVSEDTASVSHNESIQTDKLVGVPDHEDIPIPTCPRCGSTAISTTARGVNWTWGFAGASKTVNRCGNCGHTWKPKG